MPRLLVGSDFHLGPLCHEFEGRLAADALPICCGDLVNRPREDAPAFFTLLDRWRSLNPDLVMVPGNHDPIDCREWDGVRCVRRRGLTILSVPVIPIMYKIPTWTHEHSESTIAGMLDPHRGGSFDVVVSHAPPHGICDRLAWGRHIGSRALLEFAETISFRLWLCGHVHEQGGRAGRVAGRPLWNAARTILDLDLEAHAD